MKIEIIDFESIRVGNDVEIIAGNNCIINAGNNCKITAGYNAKIFIKGNGVVDVGEYGLVVDTIGNSVFVSKKGTIFNVEGTNTFNCVDSKICLQYKKRTAQIIIPNRECILKKERPSKIEIDDGVVGNDIEEDEKDKKNDNSYNILENKNGNWVSSNSTCPFDWDAAERIRRSDKKKKL